MQSILAFVRRIGRRSRTVVGLLLIASSIVGVFVVVRASAPGDAIIVATKFLPAGSVLTATDITVSRVSRRSGDAVQTEKDVIGKAIGVDLGEGDIVTSRVMEPTTESRIEIAVPLGVEPPAGVDEGSQVDLWAVDSEGVLPPITVARNAPAISFVESGFGGDTIMTLLVSSTEVDSVLGALGTSRILVATSSVTP